MDTNSYWDGRQGRPFSGGSWVDYENGRQDGTAGGSGGILGWIFLLFIVIPMAVVSVFSAFILAFLLPLLLKRLHPELPKLNFKKGFGILFKTTFLYQLVSSVSFLVLYLVLQNDRAALQLNGVLFSNSPESILIFLVAVCQLPSIFITAIFLRKKLEGWYKFRGFPGYIRTAIITLTVVMPIILLSGFLTGKVSEKIYSGYLKKQSYGFVNRE
jgi:hypothetical protein